MKHLLTSLLLVVLTASLHAQDDTLSVLSLAYLEGMGVSSVQGATEVEDGWVFWGNSEGSHTNIRIGNEFSISVRSFIFMLNRSGDLAWKQVFEHQEIVGAAKYRDHILVLGVQEKAPEVPTQREFRSRSDRRGHQGQIVLTDYNIEGKEKRKEVLGPAPRLRDVIFKVDSKGSLYISGIFDRDLSIRGHTFKDNNVQFGTQARSSFFVKLSQNLEVDWAFDNFLITDFFLTPDDLPIVTGNFIDYEEINGTRIKGTGAELPYIAKLDKEGKVIWIDRIKTWRSTSGRKLATTENYFYLAGNSNAIVLHFQDDTLRFKTQGGIFVIKMDFEGKLIDGQVIGASKGMRNGRGIIDAETDSKGNLFLTSEFYYTNLLYRGDYLNTPEFSFKMIMKFTSDVELYDYHAFSPGARAPHGAELLRTSPDDIWFASNFRDSTSFMGRAINPHQQSMYSTFFMARISGDQKDIPGGSLSNDPRQNLPQRDFWVDSYAEIDRFGLKLIFPFTGYAEIGEYIEYREGDKFVQKVIGEIDVSHLIEELNPFRYRNPEDQHRLGTELHAKPYEKAEYGPYVVSLVAGFSPYSGTALLWKKSGSVYQLVAVYPEIAGGGLYTTPSLKQNPDNPDEVIINVVGGDAGQLWGYIHYYEIKDGRLDHQRSERVRRRADSNQ